MSEKFFKVKSGITTANITFNNKTVNSNLQVSYLQSNVLSFSGTAGQLFSIADTMTGTIFAVNDISGVPSIEVYDTGDIRLAETFGNVLVGSATNPSNVKFYVRGAASITGALYANGSVGSAGQVLTSNANGIYWATAATGNVDLVQSNVSSLTTSVNTIKANVDSVQSNVSTAVTNINTVQSNVTTLASSTLYVGTTAITLNRTSAAQTLTGVSIDGTANVATYIYGRSSLVGNLDLNWASGTFGYSPTTTGTKPTAGYGTILNMVHSGTTHDNAGNWLASVAFGTEDNGAYFRTKTNNGAFSTWNTLLHNNNYNSYSPTLTGANASGSWSINSSTATALQTARNLWGQSFNGSAAVSGSLTSVGDITGTSAVALTATAGTLALAATGANIITAATNGAERIRITSGGNIGIGVTGPTRKLQVLGTTGTIAGFSGTTHAVRLESDVTYGLTGAAISAADTTLFATYQPLIMNGSQLGFALQGVEAMRIDASGSMGLGVVPSAWGSAIKALDINTAGAIVSSTNAVEVYLNSYYNGTNFIYKSTAVASKYEQSLGAHKWYNAPSGTAGNAITFTQAMTLDASGRLSIGTTSTGGSKLTVQDSSILVRTDADILKINDVADTMYWFRLSRNSSDFEISNRQAGSIKLMTADTERMRIDASGNLGIGVTPSAWVGKKAIDINTSGLGLVGGDQSFSITCNAYWDNVSWKYKGTSIYGVTNYESFNGQHKWFTAPSGTAGAAITFTQAMTLDVSGNLGIGVTTPDRSGSVSSVNRILEIDGSITLPYTVTGAEPLRIGSFANTNFTPGTSSVGDAVGLTISNWNDTGVGNGGTAIQAGVDAGGGGIELQARQTGAGVVNRLARFDIGTTTLYTNNTERMRIDSSGNIGIGATPTGYGRFEVTQATNKRILTSTAAAYGGNAIAGINDVGAEVTFGIAGNPLVFSTNAAERMRIDASGNVGIGTSSPGYKLQVNGSFAATTKSFVIDHPIKPGMKLRYGSLEGPENGVYVRGRITNHIINLPDHWEGLVDPDSITVSLTPIGNSAMPSVLSYDNKQIILSSSTIDCFYHVFGERKDVDKLVVEF